MEGPKSLFHYHSARQLRFITIWVFVPGLILLLIAGFSTRNELPFVNIVPLTLSVLLSLAAVASKDRPMPWIMYADLCMAIFIVSVLIPTYVHSDSNTQHPLKGQTHRGKLLPTLAKSSQHIYPPRDIETAYSFHALTISKHFRWVFLAEHNQLNVSEILLCAYGTTPLVADLYVRLPECACFYLFP